MIKNEWNYHEQEKSQTSRSYFRWDNLHQYGEQDGEPRFSLNQDQLKNISNNLKLKTVFNH